MNKALHSCLLTAALLSANALAAQTAPAAATTPASPAAAAAPAAPAEALEILEANGQKFAKISTIKSIPANYEFQKNVQLVRQQREAATEFLRRKEQAFTTGEKEVLQQRYEEVAKALDTNNEAMFKSYRFSVWRNYMVQIVKSRIYEPLSDEAYNRLTTAEKDRQDFIISRPSKDKDNKDITVRLRYVATIDGVAKNEAFQQAIQRYQQLRQRTAQLVQAQPHLKTDEDKKKVEAAIKEANDESAKISNEIYTNYGFTLRDDHTMEIEEAVLYAALTEDELKKAQDPKNNTPPAAPAAGAAPAAAAPAPAAR